MGPRTTYYAYRLLARFAEVLPASAIRPASRLAASIGYKALPSRRSLVERNLCRVTGKEASPEQVKAAYASYIRYWLESLRLPVVPVEQLQRLFSHEGAQHLFDAHAQGKGVVVALPHMGNWDVAGAWFAGQGLPLTVVVEQLSPPELFTWFQDFRSSLGLNVLVNGPSVGVALLKALKQGHVVALLSDRDVDGTGMELEFFGERTTVPKGPATLALRAGAPLLTMAVYDDGPGYRAVVEAPIDLERRGRLGDDVERITRDVTARLEGLIRRAPEQWHLFVPNWPSDHDPSS